MKSEAQCCLCCWFSVILASVILFACSFTTMDVNNLGLEFNSINRQYNKGKIYGPGRYMLGLARQLEAFPTTWTELSFCPGCPNGNAITGRVGVGSSAVSVHVSLTCYYKLRVEYLPEIISFFPQKNWEARYITIIKNAVAVVIGSGTLQMEQFLTDRDYVAKVIGWEINARLQPVYGYVTAVYLGAIGLGSTSFSTIDNVYLNKQISIRRAVTSGVEGETQVIEAQANQNVSKIYAEERQILDDTYRQTNFTVAEYAARGQGILLDAQGSGYLYVQSRLNFSQTDLIKFIYFDKMRSTVNELVGGFPVAKYDSLVSTV
ncbi:unnamed protein product [Amoebophrya sp. A120]|nr:unnamed protein product [Amoebophrya sp. A120]|eukprot:GSA120T00023743001.1